MTQIPEWMEIGSRILAFIGGVLGTLTAAAFWFVRRAIVTKDDLQETMQQHQRTHQLIHDTIDRSLAEIRTEMSMAAAQRDVIIEKLSHSATSESMARMEGNLKTLAATVTGMAENILTIKRPLDTIVDRELNRRPA